jgi:hypothetical protein
MSAVSEARHRADAQVQHTLYLMSLPQHPVTAIEACDEAIKRVRTLERALVAARANLKAGQRDTTRRTA